MRCAWILLVAIGCYEAPDYGGTHFKCDDNHACPSGQACVNGVCDGTGSGSGSGSDGGMIDAPPAALGVKCGSVTCASSQKCCADFVNGVSCIALAASCSGYTATCDGREDCGTGYCCDTGGAAECLATCMGQTICTDNPDCPTEAPICCTNLGTIEPWGRCFITCP